jgi:hypothetical protein
VLALAAVLAALAAETWSVRERAGFAEREVGRVTRLVDASRIGRQTALLAAKPRLAGTPENAEAAKLIEERLSRTGMKVWDARFEAEIREPVSRPLRNLFALLPGRSAAARPVLVGTHYDASGSGTSDSASATAVLLEAAEVLAAVRSGGWQPERNILFAFWDGGEAGLLGSSAYVEQGLRDRIALPMAYVDVGTAARGKTFLGRATPGLRGVLEKVLRADNDPETGKPLSNGEGTFPLPDFTGDAAPFLGLTATPVAELGFGKSSAATLARLLSLFAGTLASERVLPYRFTEISDDFRATLRLLQSRAVSVNDWAESLPGLQMALDGFEEAAKRWDAGGPRLRRLSAQKNQAANRLLERAMDVFSPSGGPSVPWGRGSLLVGPQPGNESRAAPHASLERALLARDFDAIGKESSERARALSQAQELLRAAEWIALGPGKPVRSARTLRP